MIATKRGEEPCGAKDRDRYPTGAYCPLHWDNPKTILIERAQYAAWWAGVDMVAHELSGKLTTIGVLPPSAAHGLVNPPSSLFRMPFASGMSASSGEAVIEKTRAQCPHGVESPH